MIPGIKNIHITSLFLILVICLGITAKVNAQMANIKNDVFWDTKQGQPIYSQGGGIFRFTDPATGIKKYYWYGVHYLEAEHYRKAPNITQGKNTFESVTCYSSVDLVNWTFEADVLTKEDVNGSGKTWVGRLGVAYIRQLKKYAMLVQHGNQVLITIADSPAGQFKWDQRISMKQMIGTSNTGDQTVFTDEDTGKSYLVYSYGRGRNKIYLSEIGVKNGKVSLMDCTQIFKGESREGNCMFKYNGHYYMFASNIYGWDASHAYYLVADNIRGPYLPVNKMLITDGATEDYAHVSQTGFFYVVKGSEKQTVIYCGDRWANFAGNGLGYNQWCPLSFDRKTPYFNSLGSWDLDAKTGKWAVADDNNYVKNGSFEADRKRIPSVIKPVQTQLTGWLSTVIEGNKLGLDSAVSPALNHFNSESDRQIVIGEKSLKMADTSPFKRKVSQQIASSSDVKLEDGFYTLTAKVKTNAGIRRLEIYAQSGGKIHQRFIPLPHPAWETINLTDVLVRGGKVDVGFIAEGITDGVCLVDDVSLVKRK